VPHTHSDTQYTQNHSAPLYYLVCRVYFLPMWSKMEAKLLTKGVAPGTVAGALKSAHLVRSIPGITPLRHGTLGFLQWKKCP